MPREPPVNPRRTGCPHGCSGLSPAKTCGESCIPWVSEGGSAVGTGSRPGVPPSGHHQGHPANLKAPGVGAASGKRAACALPKRDGTSIRFLQTESSFPTLCFWGSNFQPPRLCDTQNASPLITGFVKLRALNWPPTPRTVRAKPVRTNGSAPCGSPWGSRQPWSSCPAAVGGTPA